MPTTEIESEYGDSREEILDNHKGQHDDAANESDASTPIYRVSNLPNENQNFEQAVNELKTIHEIEPDVRAQNKQLQEAMVRIQQEHEKMKEQILILS